ncbi:class I adenylate-forming enzyme family protein [Tsukamurella soli]|uniref:Acyl--CoA ligase n=1 Tax=Tsukamurella soli TaxID=644556 RepID=A0ABP8J2Z1_9ACTN
MRPTASTPSTSGLAALIRARAQGRSDAVFLEAGPGDADPEPRRLTFAELGELARRRSAQLQATTVPGARVALAIADPVDLAAAFVTIVAAGRTAVPLDPDAPIADLRRTVGRVRPDALLTDRAELAGLGLPLLAVAPEASADGPADTEVSGAVLLSTSGSTGEPKSVILSEARILHVAEAVATHNELTPADRGFNCLPLFHINAEVVAVLASLYAGATLVLARRFVRTDFWVRLADARITWLNAVPAILAILSAQELPPPLPGLRFIRSASAPLPAAVRERVSALAVPLVESYGMTEAASQITATPLHGSAPARSCGRPVGVELEIRDDAGQPVPAGTVGRVTIRGASVIAGYDGGRDAARFDGAGWLDTDDIGHLDDDGFLYLAGRRGDAVNRGGELVYPREIEEVLQDDPGVREVVVTGRDDEVLGAVPVAFVIPTDPAAPTDDLRRRLAERCSRQLARAKRPAVIEVVEELPRAATGKVARHRLARLGS